MSIQQIQWGDLLDMLDMASARARDNEPIERLMGVSAIQMVHKEIVRRVISGEEATA